MEYEYAILVVLGKMKINDIPVMFKAEAQNLITEATKLLEYAKKKKLTEVNDWTGNKIVSGFKSKANGQEITYDSDIDTQITMQGIALNVDTELFAEKYPTGCPVRGYAANSDTKSVFMLTPKQVMNWQADLSIHIGNCKQAGWEKQAEVEAAKTIQDLENIKLD